MSTITVDEPLQRELDELAAARGMTVDEIVREALEEKLAHFRRRRLKSVGIGASGYTDTAKLSGDVRPEPRTWR
jgi:predicted transcriptional regulator